MNAPATTRDANLPYANLLALILAVGTVAFAFAVVTAVSP
jgi:hypothetical protein